MATGQKIKAIGIDLGGTHLRLACVSPSGLLSRKQKIVVPPERDPQAIVALIKKSVCRITGRRDGTQWTIGMGVPGIVSAQKGIVYASPHFPRWKNVALMKGLQRALSLPVAIDNDANMIALGEGWRGAGKGWKDFIMMTLGTGIGGGLVIDKRIFQGTRGFAGEIGHMVIEEDGPPCACGSHGCLETLVSATALKRRVDEEIRDGNLSPSLKKIQPSRLAKKVYVLAESGHQTAGRIYHELGRHLGVGIASLVNVTGIQNIVIGGGMRHAHRLLLPAAWEEIRRRTYRQTAKGIQIRLSRLGDDAGLLGSAAFAQEKFTSSRG